jgi:hypothetical protein
VSTSERNPPTGPLELAGELLEELEELDTPAGGAPRLELVAALVTRAREAAPELEELERELAGAVTALELGAGAIRNAADHVRRALAAL